ncbi:MAG: DUF1674 domain-containing protein [Steroidobacteraceae bacterium]
MTAHCENQARIEPLSEPALHRAAAPAAAPAAALREVGGRAGPEPTRFGDWELRGRCIDF